MARPSNRCDHVYKPDADLFKPYCCWRETSMDGKCIWHARARQKPVRVLQAARVAGRGAGPEESGDRWVGHGGERLDGAFLKEADCKRIGFQRCTLFGANLSSADLRGADCTGADLRHANCSDATARQAVFEGTILREADLSGIDLRGANLEGADLRRATLRGADLTEANLEGADLRRADLQGADLQGADLPGANCYDADLTDASIVEADLQGTTFGDATLSGIHAMRADLRDAKLPDVDATEGNFEKATFSEVIMSGATFTGADLSAADFTGADAVGADFTRATLERARMSRADCYDASFDGAHLYGAVMGGVQINEGTSFDRRVVYDPSEGGELATDGGTAVDDVTKAVGTYRILEQLARENELSDLRTRYALRRRDVRRRTYRRDGNWLQWLRSMAVNATVRYGEQPWRVVFVGVATILAFGFLYPLRMVARDGQVLTYTGGVGEVLTVMGEGLYFSAVTFTTGATPYEAVGLGRILAALEGGIGIIVFALLIYAFARQASQ